MSLPQEPIPTTYQNPRIQSAILKFNDVEKGAVIQGLRISYCEGVRVIDEIRLSHISYAATMQIPASPKRKLGFGHI